MVESGNLVKLEMLEVAEKDPVVSASAWKAPSPMPRREPPVSVTAPSEQCNDCHALYDDKHLDYVSICLFIDSAVECVIITSASI